MANVDDYICYDAENLIEELEKIKAMSDDEVREYLKKLDPSKTDEDIDKIFEEVEKNKPVVLTR